MRDRPLTVGLSSALSVDRTPHACTVVRAIATALNYMPGASRLSLALADDAASADLAIPIAHRFIEHQVDVVIGPFASDCCLATAEIYAAAKIPLVLPGATVEVAQNGAGCFRLCPSDGLIGRQIADRAIARGFSQVALQAGESAHSRRLRDAVSRNLTCRQVQIVELDAADAAIYVGTLASSKKWLSTLRGRGCRLPVLLTDDAAREELLHNLPCAGDIEVFGFPTAAQIPAAAVWAARYARHYGASPPIYFLEVLSAMAVVIQAATSNRPCRESLEKDAFVTPFGLVRFEGGERTSATCAIWRPGSDGTLRPCEVIPVADMRSSERRRQVARIS